MQRPDWAGVLGNERLTAIVGTVLLVLVGLEVLTAFSLRSLMFVHLLAGLVLVGPLALKLASTGYRFVRYYLRAPSYVRRGPPALPLRILAVPLVPLTVVVVGSGVALVLTAPAEAGALVVVHNLSVLLWLPLIAVHALAYLGRLPAILSEERQQATPAVPGRAIRLTTTAGACLLGIAAALLLLPDATPWLVWSRSAQSIPGPFVAGIVLAAIAILLARPWRFVHDRHG
jgi:hypothetical protein